MAGVRIGKAALDGTDIDKVIAGLRSGRPEIILPPAVLQLPEALPHRQWKRRYGPLEERRMMRQERLIGNLLDRRSEEHTSELQSLMRISYAVFCLKKQNNKRINYTSNESHSNKHMPQKIKQY